jgi:hypothetical protein
MESQLAEMKCRWPLRLALGSLLGAFLSSAISGCATSRPAAPMASDAYSPDHMKMGPSLYETGRVAPMRVANPSRDGSAARAGELRGSPSRPGTGAHRRHRRSGGSGGSRDPLALRGA